MSVTHRQIGIQRLMTEKPRYPHDCKHCHFLGWYEDYDLYFCTQGDSIPTVIARYGKGGNYLAGMPKTTAGPIVPLQIARHRAISGNLYDPEANR